MPSGVLSTIVVMLSFDDERSKSMDKLLYLYEGSVQKRKQGK